jgi:hypothetical protein
LERMLALLADGRLDPQISLTAPWQEPMPLIDALIARNVSGKTVLVTS